MKIVTSGSRYVDIDAYGGCIAYAELLQKQGHEAQAVCTPVLNESITPSVLAWNAPLARTYTPSNDDTFILIDLSGPDQFETFVDLERVEEVIDHHPYFEAYWQKRPSTRAQIELVGAACTQVYERWKAADKLDEMSETSARLLICGILDNTLNFGAAITTDRDHQAYDALLKLAHLPDNWTATYFEECQVAITDDLATALHNDTKIVQFKTFTETMRVGQMVIWDAADVLPDAAALGQAMEAAEPFWFVNIVSISEGKNYLLCTNPAVQAWLSQLLDVQFSGDLAHTDRLWLRKEIMHRDQETVEL